MCWGSGEGMGKHEISAGIPASPSASVSFKIHCAGPVVKETLLFCK